MLSIETRITKASKTPKWSFRLLDFFCFDCYGFLDLGA